MLHYLLTSDPRSRNARLWSNSELRKAAHLFTGDVVNVSAWRDQDKEGNSYQSYFLNAESYSTTNFNDPEARGADTNQESNQDIDLDLTDKETASKFSDRFDTVFNHTTLEHIFEFETAFQNLCTLSKDIVIIVVPFLQETHGSYGDYWRFTPQSLDKLYKKFGLTTMYINCNDQSRDAMYVFAIGSKKPEKWSELKALDDNQLDFLYTDQYGTKIIKDTIPMRLRKWLARKK